MRFRQASFIAFVFAWFFPKFYNNGGNQKLKAWSFQLRKNCFCMLNIKRPIAHQSSIIFFIHPVFSRLVNDFVLNSVTSHLATRREYSSNLNNRYNCNE